MRRTMTLVDVCLRPSDTSCLVTFDNPLQLMDTATTAIELTIRTSVQMSEQYICLKIVAAITRAQCIH